MADTKIRAEKATDLLKEDHQKVKKLFAEYEAVEAGAMDRKLELFGRIQRELRIHAAIEEELFYPAVEGVQKGKRDGVEAVAEAIEEHKVVRTLLDELAGLDPGFEAFDAKMKVLRENVEHHADEEEDEMFPLFGQLEKEDQESVSEDLASRKAELTRETPNE